MMCMELLKAGLLLHLFELVLDEFVAHGDRRLVKLLQPPRQ